MFPQEAEAIFGRYGLGGAPERHAADRAWKERLRKSPREHQEWMALYQRYQAYLTQQGHALRQQRQHGTTQDGISTTAFQ